MMLHYGGESCIVHLVELITYLTSSTDKDKVMTKTINERVTVSEIAHDDSVKRIIIAEQFSNDFTLVMLNDYEAYTELMADTKNSESMAELSDKLREEYETLTAQIVELVEDKVSPIASLLMAQLLQGQGSLPFDLIAKQLREAN